MCFADQNDIFKILLGSNPLSSLIRLIFGLRFIVYEFKEQSGILIFGNFIFVSLLFWCPLPWTLVEFLEVPKVCTSTVLKFRDSRKSSPPQYETETENRKKPSNLEVPHLFFSRFQNSTVPFFWFAGRVQDLQFSGPQKCSHFVFLSVVSD